MSRMLRALGIGVLLTMSAAAAVKIEKINFKGWPNSYRMTNGEVELVITGDVGPRIIRYAFVGGQNLFKEYADQVGKSGEKEWQIRGGHRLWVGPEVPPPSPVTYALDNFPVNIAVKGDTIEATPQKIGSFNKDTFGAYYLNGELFIKRYQADTSKTYPDMGASFETFTNADMLESETMGPLTKLAPGATLEHVERWTLHKGVKIGSWTDAELDRVVLPLVKTGR